MPGAEAAAGTADGGAAPLRVNVTEGNFQELVELSAQVPVVFALWAAVFAGIRRRCSTPSSG